MMTYLTTTQIAAIGLPKWPGCDVTGDSITPDQAMEILVRTNGTYFDSNDREFEEIVEEIFFTAIPHPEWEENWWTIKPDYMTPAEKARIQWNNYWKRSEQYSEEMGMLDIQYLTNDRVVSSYIGGPNGWCDWLGNIYLRGKNIGKWPSTTEVFHEWKTIAEAFPFLNLTCRLLSNEAGYEDEGEPPVIAIVYEVSGGGVKVRLPNEEDMNYVTTSSNRMKDVDLFIRDINNPFRERGVTPAKWKQACEFVAKKQQMATC